MKLWNWTKQQLDYMKDSTRRFPIAIFLVFLCTAVLLWLNIYRDQQIQLGLYDDDLLQKTLQRILLSAGLGIPLLLGLAQLAEHTRAKLFRKILSFSLAGLFLIGYGLWLLPDMGFTDMIRYLILLGVSVVFMLAASYFPNRAHFSLYVTARLIRFFVTALYALILMLSLFAILFTLDNLLNMTIKSIAYTNTASLVWMGFAPLFYIAGIPAEDREPVSQDSPKTLRFLLLYILVPLLAVYSLILYAYTLRIVFEGAWPKGMVSSLMLSHATISLFVLMLTKPLRDENRIAQLFGKWFPKISLPLFVVLFLALSVRLREYGITEARYFALVLAIWCFGAMLYAAVSKRPRSMVWAVSLAVVAILSVTGFASAWQVSKFSQNLRLEGILQKNNMLADGKVIPSSSLSESDRVQIAEILRYFDHFHEYSDIRSLPEDFNASNSVPSLGFQLFDVNPQEPLFQYVMYTLDDTLLDIQGYEQMLFFSYKEEPSKGSSLAARIDYDAYRLFLTENGKTLWSLELVPYLHSLFTKYATDDDKQLPQEDLTIDAETENYRIQVIFTRIEGNILTGSQTDENNKPTGYADGLILINRK